MPQLHHVGYWFARLCPPLEIDQRAQSLANLLIEQHAIPASEPNDALHIATATVHGVDYLASWNFVHLVGASAKFRLQQHIAALGWKPPIIATPEELLEEML